jgi:hypothetical protein
VTKEIVYDLVLRTSLSNEAVDAIVSTATVSYCVRKRVRIAWTFGLVECGRSSKLGRDLAAIESNGLFALWAVNVVGFIKDKSVDVRSLLEDLGQADVGSDETELVFRELFY